MYCILYHIRIILYNQYNLYGTLTKYNHVQPTIPITLPNYNYLTIYITNTNPNPNPCPYSYVKP